MTWDWIISILIIVSLILVFAARITGQTIREMLEDFREMIFGGTEEVADNFVSVYG